MSQKLFSASTDNTPLSEDTTLASKLQHVIDTTISGFNHDNIKGISAAVIIPGQPVWQGVSGISHTGTSITPATRFGIGSNTKAFTAVMLLKLAEQGVLSLDDQLHEWLPAFKNVDSTITIRQLLNHSSGVYSFNVHPDYYNAMIGNFERIWTPEEIVSGFVNEPYFPPGQGFEYSNTNYLLAGMIIKAATGVSVSTRLRQTILNPYGLSSTYFDVEETVSGFIAHPWESGFDISSYSRNSFFSSIWASGCMFSTSENIARWYQYLFGGLVLTQSSLNQMLTTIPAGSGLSYGLGLWRLNSGGRIKWFHDGSWRGYLSMSMFDSTEKYSITVLLNKRPADILNLVLTLDRVIIENSIGIRNLSGIVPENFSLSQNYPNPFNPVTKIKFSVVNSTRPLRIKIIVVDGPGRVVGDLVDENLPVGNYETEFNGENLASGVYYYTMLANGSVVDSKKMIFMK